MYTTYASPSLLSSSRLCLVAWCAFVAVYLWLVNCFKWYRVFGVSHWSWGMQVLSRIVKWNGILVDVLEIRQARPCQCVSCFIRGSGPPTGPRCRLGPTAELKSGDIVLSIAGFIFKTAGGWHVVCIFLVYSCIFEPRKQSTTISKPGSCFGTGNRIDDRR